MSDIIHLLPDSIANQIAAGEVIQRPASVIKELVENAVDAGATHIDVLVVDAGRTSIQVIDDGKGMSETDARLSFERHATSKISKADDLFDLHTMGFRGEALASIAAVAQVELKTRTADEEVGTHLTITGSKFMGQEPVACQQGANFLIENLFFNVPARRKFLKSNTTELNNILAAFQRIVLVYPKIHFRFFSNGTELYSLKPCTLRQRIVDIFGQKLNQELLPVKVETTFCTILGFVGKPESARKKEPRQYFFVNGRFMRHPYFHKAVISAYGRLLPPGDQVPYFLYFDVDPKDIDVNIHPTKTEIKFENEQPIWQILEATVKDAVGMFSNVSTLDFDEQGKPDIPVFDPSRQAQMPKVKVDTTYNPFKSTPASAGFKASKVGGETFSDGPKSDPADWQQLYQGLENRPAPEAPGLFESPAEAAPASPIEEKSPTHYQYKGQFIMTAVKSGLMIIDQHRAHVRILFEQFQRQLAQRKIHSQKVLFPQTVHLDMQQVVTLGNVEDELAQCGFELTSLGGGSYALNAIPAGLEGVDPQQLLQDLLAGSAEQDASALQKINDSMALTLAQAAAIPYGQVLSNEEMEDIVNRLFQCSSFNYTPNGKTILCILPQSQIEQLLG
jgi:DNA mismatch repair protein MutL